MSSIFGGSGSSSFDAAPPKGMHAPSFPFPCPDSNLYIMILHGDERSQCAQGGGHGFCAQRACPRECARTHQRSCETFFIHTSHVCSFDRRSYNRSLQKTNDKCFAKCVTKPSTSLSGSEEVRHSSPDPFRHVPLIIFFSFASFVSRPPAQTCLSRCFDRYMEACKRDTLQIISPGRADNLGSFSQYHQPYLHRASDQRALRRTGLNGLVPLGHKEFPRTMALLYLRLAVLSD